MYDVLYPIPSLRYWNGSYSGLLPIRTFVISDCTYIMTLQSKSFAGEIWVVTRRNTNKPNRHLGSEAGIPSCHESDMLQLTGECRASDISPPYVTDYDD